MNKIDEKTRRLTLWMKGKPQPPYTIELIPTNRCNFKCKSCWRRNFSEKELEKEYSQELSDDRLIQLIDEASKLGVKEIAFVGGGEPLCRDITPFLMKKIRGADMEGDLVTNGSLFTDDLIHLLVNIKWTRVKFSIDGSIAEIQNQLRGIDCFDKIINNIKKLSRVKKENHSEFPRIGFNIVVSKSNYKDLPNIVRLAHETGGDEISLLPITVFSEEGKKLKMNSKQIAKFQGIIKKCLPALKEYNISSNMDKFLDARYVDRTNEMHKIMMEEAEKASGKEEKLIKGFKEDSYKNFWTVPCFEPWSHVTIIHNGNIACCFNNYVWNTNVSIKDASLKELWYGPYFQKYREEILTGKLSDACATCCVWRAFETKDIRKKIKSELENKGLVKRIKERIKQCTVIKKKTG